MVLPLIRPGVIAGGFIAFMSSFDNVPVSLFLRDAATDMLPIRMWQDLEGKLDVTIAALSGVLIIATVALMAIMERVDRPVEAIDQLTRLTLPETGNSPSG